MTTTKEFLWVLWLKDVCKWMSIGVIFVFIIRTANNTGVWEDLPTRLIALFGMVGYFVLVGLDLLKKNHPYYYRIHEHISEDKE